MTCPWQPLALGDGVSHPDTHHIGMSSSEHRCRMCPGRWLAKDAIWLIIASVLATYDIRKPVDERGVPIEPNVEYTSSTVRYVLLSCIHTLLKIHNLYTSRPKPFKCVFTLRSESAKA